MAIAKAMENGNGKLPLFDRTDADRFGANANAEGIASDGDELTGVTGVAGMLPACKVHER